MVLRTRVARTPVCTLRGSCCCHSHLTSATTAPHKDTWIRFIPSTGWPVLSCSMLCCFVALLHAVCCLTPCLVLPCCLAPCPELSCCLAPCCVLSCSMPCVVLLSCSMLCVVLLHALCCLVVLLHALCCLVVLLHAVCYLAPCRVVLLSCSMPCVVFLSCSMPYVVLLHAVRWRQVTATYTAGLPTWDLPGCWQFWLPKLEARACPVTPRPLDHTVNVRVL